MSQYQSIIRWNPQLFLLEKYLLARIPFLSDQDGVVSRLKTKVCQGFELSDQAKRDACCNSIQMSQLDY